MATAKKTSTRSTKTTAQAAARPNRRAAPAKGRTATRARQPDAIALLKADHERVSTLFDQYEKSRSVQRKRDIVASICRELSVHAMLEEEIFYPAVKAALKDKELVPEAVVEHATLKEFIAKVDGKEPDGEMFDAQIQVMGEYVKHHVKEEQTEMFPKARKARLDLAALAQRMTERKQQLMADPAALPKAPTAVSELPSRIYADESLLGRAATMITDLVV